MINENTFCSLPFVHISNRTGGYLVPCCLFEGEIQDEKGRKLKISDGDTFEKAFKTQYMQELRENLKKGIKDLRCSRCWKDEDLGLQSKRQFDGGRFLKKALKIAEADLPAFEPLSWDIKLGSLCNLKCRMCDAESSSALMLEEVGRQRQSAEEASHFLEHNKDYTSLKSFKDELLFISKYVEEIYFLGGEPTHIHGQKEILREIISSGRAADITLRWSTNATGINDEWLQLASNFKKVIFDCSIDGHGKLNEYIRYPSGWVQVTQNVKKIKQQLKYVEVKIVCTVSLYNIDDLENLYTWSIQEGHNLVFNYLDKPTHLHIKHVPNHFKKYLEKKYKSINPQFFRELLSVLSQQGSLVELKKFLTEVETFDKHRGQKAKDIWSSVYWKSLYGEQDVLTDNTIYE
jgi:sulfatase maturation enzyme AslB (radical SAM superfamily)